MALFSSALQTLVGFFHSKSKTLTEETQAPYEALYKSSHSSKSGDVWADSIAYCVDVAAANSEAISNPAITKYTLQTMTEVGGSNGQAYYFDSGGIFIRPWVAPTDIPNVITSAPSYGFQANIFQGDDTLITPTEGRFVIDYYAGIVQFESGYTPVDMGWGAIKCTIFVYTGGMVKGIQDPNFSYRIVENETVTIPYTQQMALHSEELVIGTGGILLINGSLFLEP